MERWVKAILVFTPPLDWLYSIRDPDIYRRELFPFLRKPTSKPVYGTIEHCFIYMPLGFVVSYILGLTGALLFLVIAVAIGLPIELFMMHRGILTKRISTWETVDRLPLSQITIVMLFNVYNIVVYYAIGALLGIWRFG